MLHASIRLPPPSSPQSRSLAGSTSGSRSRSQPAAGGEAPSSCSWCISRRCRRLIQFIIAIGRTGAGHWRRARGRRQIKRQHKGPTEVNKLEKEFGAGFGSEYLNRAVPLALKRPVQRGSKPAATFFDFVKSYLACGKREAGDFDMLYCYNVPDLVTAALHYAVDRASTPSPSPTAATGGSNAPTRSACPTSREA
jgi:hypothetical protein